MEMNERKINSLTNRAMAAEAELKAERLKNRELSERVRRMAEEAQHHNEEMRSLRDELRSLRETNAEQLDRLQRNVQQMADFMLGKGPVNIGDELRKAVEDGIRAEYESLIRTRDAEIAALREALENMERRNGDDDHRPMGGNVPVKTKVESIEQQNRDLRTQAYGKKSEKQGSVQCSAQMSADEMDMEGMDAPTMEITEETAIALAAVLLAKTHGKPGPKGKRSAHPASAYASEMVIEPEDVPEGARLLAKKEDEENIVKVYWIEGHVRIVKIKRPKYYKDGRHYQAPAPKFLLGNTQIDISFLIHILEMFVVHRVTIGTIEEWIADQGLDFDHATVIGWIRKAADMLEPIDGPLHDAITAQDNNHVDETTIRVCDTPLNVSKAQAEDLGMTLSDEECKTLSAMQQKHYFVRWLFAFLAPSNGLVQYRFNNRGSRKVEAVDEYYKDLDHKIYLHTDGAKMYDKYDTTVGNLIKIGCAVHIRRAFFKLRESSSDACDLLTLFERFFSTIARIKKTVADVEERKRRQLLEGLPILMDVEEKMKELQKLLDKATSPDLFKALAYGLKELPSVMRAFERGDLEFSNNICEQQMRRIAIYRNNSLHCGSVESTVRWARLQSIAQSCRNNGKNFKRYIRDLLTTIIKTPKNEIRDKISGMLPNLWTDPMPYAIPAMPVEPSDAELVFGKK